MLDIERRTNLWGIENLTFQQFLDRLGCKADTYKEVLAHIGYQLDTTSVDASSHLCQFFLFNGNHEDSKDAFGFAVLFIKRSGRCDERSPDSIYVANNPDEWINVFRFVADRDSIRTQSNRALSD